MAASNDKKSGAESVIGSLRKSGAGKQLADASRHLAEAQTNRVAERLGKGADALTAIGEGGPLPAIGKVAKHMVPSALGSAGKNIAEKVSNIAGSGNGKGSPMKAMKIEESTDIGVPVTTVYNQWTQFSEFSRFMKGVETVEFTSDTESNWRTKVFKSHRSWKATIQEQVPDRRIVWTSEGAKGSTTGVVTFHPLADDLTRVLVAVEYHPSGFMEKTGNLWRAAGRRVRLDLKNFRQFVMLEGHETGAWRGEVHDAEVTESAEDRGSAEESEDDNAAPDEADEESADDERGEQDEQDDDEEDEEEPEQEEPARPAARRSTGERGQSRPRSAPRGHPERRTRR